MALPAWPTTPICCPATHLLAVAHQQCLHVGVPGRELARRPSVTMTSQGPDQPWSVRITTVPSLTASTGVPHAVEKSSPVCTEAQWRLR